MKKSTVEKRLICLKCNLVVRIHRKANKDRKAGHRKHLWCAVCKKKTPHRELARWEEEGGLGE